MSILNSNSTIDEIKSSYLENMSYSEDGSAIKAKAFITACRGLLSLPSTVMHMNNGGQEQVSINHESLIEQIKVAETWINQNETISGAKSNVRAFSFTGYRG